MVIERKHKNKILDIKIDKCNRENLAPIFCALSLASSPYFSVLLPLYTYTHAADLKFQGKPEVAEPLLKPKPTCTSLLTKAFLL